MSTNLWRAVDRNISGPERPGRLVGVSADEVAWEEQNQGWEYHLEKTAIAFELDEFKKSPSAASVRSLTRILKRTMRNGSAEELAHAKGLIEKGLGDAKVQEYIFEDYLTPFGGYSIALPFNKNITKWSGAISWNFHVMGSRKVKIGGTTNRARIHTEPAPELEAHEVTGATKRQYRARMALAAEKNESVFGKVDIVGVSGHHFAGHLVPGLFTNVDEYRVGFDLRYSLEIRPGGFPNVRLFFAAGCKSTCTSAQQVIRKAFPNALILGSKNAMPVGGGKARLREFRQRCKALDTPFLLDRMPDLVAIAGAWRQGASAALLETTLNGITRADVAGNTQPASSWGDRVITVKDLDPYEELELQAAHADNACGKGADDTQDYPAPK